MYEESGKISLGSGYVLEWGPCACTETPRGEWCSWRLLTWTKSYLSPDENPYARPQDFVKEKLDECFSQDELYTALLRGALVELEAKADAQEGDKFRSHAFISGEAFWERDETYDGRFTKDELVEIIADDPNAPALLASKLKLKTLYLYEHSGTVLAAHPFSDTWDFCPVGFAYARFGSSAGLDMLARELEEYNAWANGETYCYALTEGAHSVVQGFVYGWPALKAELDWACTLVPASALGLNELNEARRAPWYDACLRAE